MKKIFLLAIAAAFSYGSIAQGNSKNKQHKHESHKHHNHQKGKKSKDRVFNDNRPGNDDWRNRDDDRRHRDDRNVDWRTGRNDDRRYDNRRNDQYNNGKAPRKVIDAFYRDYPNASNVTWSKDRGVWSARFKRSGLFGGNNTVSYRANGERITNNNLVLNRPF